MVLTFLRAMWCDFFEVKAEFVNIISNQFYIQIKMFHVMCQYFVQQSVFQDIDEVRSAKQKHH